MKININNNTNTYDYMNSFFGGTSSANQSTSNTSNLLGDYFSIRNGTYLKVAKKFYSDEANLKKKPNSIDKTDQKKLDSTKLSAEATVGSLIKLMDNKLYNKIDKRDADGNRYTDYNKEEIFNNLNKFIDSYNNLVKNAGELEDRQTLKNSVRMVEQIKVYSGALGKIGISIEDDNTLKLNEDIFNKADMSDVKSMFTGNVSFAKIMQNKFLNIYNSASNTITAVDGLYSAKATNNMSIGSMFDSMF